MTLHITRHAESSVLTGRPGTVPSLPIEGQRLASAIDSKAFAGPCELRMLSDDDCFVAIAKSGSPLDPAAETALRVSAGGELWIALGFGDWKVRWA